MGRLLLFEIHKLLKMKSFYICSLLILVASALSISVVKVGIEVFKVIDQEEISVTENISAEEINGSSIDQSDRIDALDSEGIPFDVGNIPGAQGVGLIEGMVFGTMTIETYMLNAIDSGEFILLFTIFAVIYICDDYIRQKTIKNVYSHGFSRTQVFFSKLKPQWRQVMRMRPFPLGTRTVRPQPGQRKKA